MIGKLLPAALLLAAALTAAAQDEYRVPQTSEAWQKWKAAGYVSTIAEIEAATKPTDDPEVEELISTCKLNSYLLLGSQCGTYSPTFRACVDGQLAVLSKLINDMDELPAIEKYVFKFDWQHVHDNRRPHISCFRALANINCMRLQRYADMKRSDIPVRSEDADQGHMLFEEKSYPESIIGENLRWSHWLANDTTAISILIACGIDDITAPCIAKLLPELSDVALNKIISAAAVMIPERRKTYLRYMEFCTVSNMLLSPQVAIRGAGTDTPKAMIYNILSSCEKAFDRRLPDVMLQIDYAGKPFYQVKDDIEKINGLYRPDSSGSIGGEIVDMTAFPELPHFIQRLSINADLLNRVRILCALELYRRANGAWPDKLESLVPKFLPELPVSEITGKPFEYLHGKIEYNELILDFRHGCIFYENKLETANGVMLPAPRVGVVSGIMRTFGNL